MNAVPFKDHFSGQAADYARFRPQYPNGLFDYLAAVTPVHQLAWDAGTGSGQIAVALASHFDQVIATDPSASQIAHAGTRPNIEYRVEAAERPSLAPASVDLITVGQALHWFDQPAFYAAVDRVLKPGGVLAVWCYERCHIDAEIDAVLDRYYHEVVGAYWPPERQHIENGYRDMVLPYPESPAPTLNLEQHWRLPDLIGYLNTWSATQRCRAAQAAEPLDAVRDELASLWGEALQVRLVEWPLSLRLAIKPA